MAIPLFLSLSMPSFAGVWVEPPALVLAESRSAPARATTTIGRVTWKGCDGQLHEVTLDRSVDLLDAPTLPAPPPDVCAVTLRLATPLTLELDRGDTYLLSIPEIHLPIVGPADGALTIELGGTDFIDRALDGPDPAADLVERLLLDSTARRE